VITAAAASLEDDLTGVAGTFTLDFLPVGAPAKDDSDRITTVVAIRWGNGSYPVLAGDVSLRRAWAAVTDRWPALSDVDLRDGSSS
jgi:hypothetical protein